MLGFTDSDLRFQSIFFPHAFKRQVAMFTSGARFVHYTTAEAAASIIRNKKVWMRKSSVMNDFLEVEHGLACLQNAYGSSVGDRFKMFFQGMHPGLVGELEASFNQWVPLFRFETYLTSMSEHDDSEDVLGRLSMWRAYASKTGVAVVMNPAVFFSQTDALHAYTSPVAYLSKDDFLRNFEDLTNGLIAEADYLRTLDRELILRNLFEVFRMAVLCTKHPGFAEEREWRIIYSPHYERSDRIEKKTIVVNGVPQSVCMLPLEDVPEEGLVGASLPALINRIIIGPTNTGYVMIEAFRDLLAEAGVPDPNDKVWFSEIPLRVS